MTMAPALLPAGRQEAVTTPEVSQEEIVVSADTPGGKKDSPTVTLEGEAVAQAEVERRTPAVEGEESTTAVQLERSKKADIKENKEDESGHCFTPWIRVGNYTWQKEQSRLRIR